MKKVLTSLSALAVSFAFVGTIALTSETASAATCTGNISYTGNGSNDTIDCTNVSNVDIVCENNVTVAKISYQNGQSGPAQVGGNTSGGSAVTGSVTNTNGDTLEIGASCGPTTTPAASVTPETPGKGAAGAGATAVKPAALPYTSGNSTLAIVVSSLVAAAAIVAGSRVAVAAYRHFSAK